MTNVMLDIETLSNTENAMIASIAAVKFDITALIALAKLKGFTV